MSIPKEPRQQMINIMYLVLTALLALNVSAEILNAFKILNTSIDRSSTSMNEQLSKVHTAFKAIKSKNPKAIKLEPYVNESLRTGDEAIHFIEGLMKDLIERSNGPAHAGIDIRKASDQNTPAIVMIKEGRASELRDVLNKAHDGFLALFATDRLDENGEQVFNLATVEAFKQEMPLKQVPKETADKFGKMIAWEQAMFHQMPMAPTITLLNKFKHDLISTQSVSVERLYRMVTEDDEPFDLYTVGLVPNGSKFIQGESYGAEVFLAASRTKSRPIIKVDGRELTVNDNGKAQHPPVVLNQVGEKTFHYSIEYINSFGEKETQESTHSISIIPPPDHVAVASPLKMNVLYIGVDNPVSASITGIPDDKVQVNMDQGRLTKTGPGNYIARVERQGDLLMSLEGKNHLNESIKLNSEFRVERIPDPQAVIDKRSGGNMQTGKWRAQRAVFAHLDFFPFETRFEVLGFEMTHARAKNPDVQICTNIGGSFSDRCLKYQQEAAPGDIYFVDEIRVRGPDDIVRTLNSISFKIK